MKGCPLVLVAVFAMASCEKGSARPPDRVPDLPTFDTEPGSPMPAEEALRAMTVPEGFTASLFAAEPMVRQPIDMKVDSKGRVWVAECYSYQSSSTSGQDRIIVLEDTDGDGLADRRTLFIDGLNHLTSVEVGFGGVWVLAPPQLLFIPDENADLVPDGDHVSRIVNWNTRGNWNMANGLVFGPDGWLYGRQGQLGTSIPMVAGTGASPGPMSGAIWRYHPYLDTLEIVAQGMTNPWGLDWNADGELFASGNCNGHLWHIVGGSLYDWGFGAREFSGEYGRTPAIEVAPHYSPGKDWWTSWQEREIMQETNDRFGGGHSHCGLVICNGDAWPESMRGHTLMSNIHGRRINEDTIEASGPSYTSHRVGDPILAGDTWFRGVSLVAAPDGALFISDWSDTGECHDQDGIHQSSGRIFRLVPESSKPFTAPNETELARLLESPREEPARIALREIQYLSRTRRLSEPTRAAILERRDSPSPTARMRVLSAMHGGGWMDEESLLAAAHDPHENVRSMAVRFWGESSPSIQTASLETFVALASDEPSPRVVLHLASVTRLLPAKLRQAITSTLLQRSEETLSPRACQLLWHIHVQRSDFSSEEATRMLSNCSHAGFSSYLVRYLIENGGQDTLARILVIASGKADPAPLITTAVRFAKANFTSLPAPPDWPALREKWIHSPLPGVRDAAMTASMLFSDHSAIEPLRKRVKDSDTPLAERIDALETIARTGSHDALDVVAWAYRSKPLRPHAIRCLRYFDDTQVTDTLLVDWREFSPEERKLVIDTFLTRTSWVFILLSAIERGSIPKTALSPPQARTVAESGDPDLRNFLHQVWGDPTPKAAARKAARLRADDILANDAIGDARAGHDVFATHCGICHQLFGEGGTFGPDLTGRDRSNLSTLLSSIIDPSAIVPDDGRLSIVTQKDGILASGIIVSQNSQSLTLRTPAGEVLIPTADIRSIETSTVSPMPEGLLDGMTDRQLLDLFTFLRAG